MKIVHLCLAAFYIDNFGYQENILPRYHKEFGHDVSIIASTETYVGNKSLGYVNAEEYFTSDQIKVCRIPYVSWIPSFFAKKIRIYEGLYEKLLYEKPKIIFIHDFQFVDIFQVIRYAKSHDVQIYVDTHADYINSAKGFISRWILHGLIYRACASAIYKVALKMYATIPIRSEFMKEVYGISGSKVELLPFGAENDKVDFSKRSEICQEVRESLGISNKDIVLAFGGKVDSRKNIHLFVRYAKKYIEENKINNLKILIFGSIADDLISEFNDFSGCDFITMVGWVKSSDIYKYLWAADLAVFPGTHSVIWEEAVGYGVPCVFKKWNGITHVDLGGNCILISEVNEMTVWSLLDEVIHSPEMLINMKNIAMDKGIEFFSYKRIAMNSIGMEVK